MREHAEVLWNRMHKVHKDDKYAEQRRHGCCCCGEGFRSVEGGMSNS
jgi:hypothetical protein